MAARVERPGEIIQGINVTPLVDVVLVLLIILMVTASHTLSRALPMQLPKASTGEASPKVPLAISVDASGALFLEGKAISQPELRSRARRASAPDGSAVIAADGSAQHRVVVAVIDLLRGEGITKLAINVAPEDLRP